MKVIFTAKKKIVHAKWGIIGTVYAWRPSLSHFDKNFLHTFFQESLLTSIPQFGHMHPPVWPCLRSQIFTSISHGAVPSYFFWLFPFHLQPRSMLFNEKGCSLCMSNWNGLGPLIKQSQDGKPNHSLASAQLSVHNIWWKIQLEMTRRARAFPFFFPPDLHDFQVCCLKLACFRMALKI